MQQPQTALLLRALRRFYRADAPDSGVENAERGSTTPSGSDNTQSEASASPLVAWLSIDPVRRKIDFYPKAIAARVEKAYQNRDPWSPSTCVLGSDFFNATVHFHPSGTLYQTTPGMPMGRAFFKPQGYRSVKRVVVKPDEGDRVTIFAKQVHGELRIAANEEDSEIKFEVTIPTESIVQGSADVGAEQYHVWTGADLESDAWDVPVVVWQWCRGVPDRHGNLMALSDDWWCPYLSEANSTIEAAFSSGEESVLVTLMDKELTIMFTRGQSFALQRIESEGKERAVRRVIKTVQKVKVMLDKMATPPLDPAELADALPQGTIPHHFFCPILQDVMIDPVKTVDGMTYDRPAIERWFTMSSTSPLTGLHLASKALVPHVTLRDQIQSFIDSHAHLMQGAQANEREGGGDSGNGDGSGDGRQSLSSLIARDQLP